MIDSGNIAFFLATREEPFVLLHSSIVSEKCLAAAGKSLDVEDVLLSLSLLGHRIDCSAAVKSISICRQSLIEFTFNV